MPFERPLFSIPKYFVNLTSLLIYGLFTFLNDLDRNEVSKFNFLRSINFLIYI